MEHLNCNRDERKRENGLNRPTETKMIEASSIVLSLPYLFMTLEAMSIAGTLVPDAIANAIPVADIDPPIDWKASAKYVLNAVNV